MDKAIDQIRKRWRGRPGVGAQDVKTLLGFIETLKQENNELRQKVTDTLTQETEALGGYDQCDTVDETEKKDEPYEPPYEDTL